MHIPPYNGMHGYEAGAADRRGPDAVRRRLPWHAHVRSERGVGRAGLLKSELCNVVL